MAAKVFMVLLHFNITPAMLPAVLQAGTRMEPSSGLEKLAIAHLRNAKVPSVLKSVGFR